MAAQKPLELILARNLLSSISTPAFLVGEHGALVYYNEAAGGHHRDVAASAIPIVGSAGSSGAIVIFWPLAAGEESERE